MHARFFHFIRSSLLATIALMSSTATFAVDLHFWPTAVVPFDGNHDNALFGWPNFQVTLHNRSQGGAYLEAAVDDTIARELSLIFAPKVDSPIQITRDERSLSWGVHIPGGSELRQSSAVLLEPMLQDFISCLATLNQNKLDRMKEIIYQPASFVSPDGLQLDAEQIAITNELYSTYQLSRCRQANIAVPELVKSKSREYLAAMLIGTANSSVSHGALLAITSAFNDLLFGAKGLFVRVALGTIQGFISERAKGFPNLTESRWLNRNYESFIDYVLLTNGEPGFTKEHYLRLGEACGIKSLNDAYKPFPLKSMITDGTINVITIHLASTQSTIFVARGHQ